MALRQALRSSFGRPVRLSGLRTYVSSTPMSVEESIREKVTHEFAPEQLLVRNDSMKHAHHAAMAAQGGGNGETHFFVEIVSDRFQGKPQIARHRAVNALLGAEFEL
ncbi:hypothetical protein MVES_000473 [Malassezia vespertilionis]|uniref:Uncharacterized protein n=1 Tax=Malassezia vespertilionis TaxID=2020962 RepID=A0A2N1JGG9_9BASI|nr:hypothetical protein MVES_000473 [Malassezia vespertilionis]